MRILKSIWSLLTSSPTRAKVAVKVVGEKELEAMFLEAPGSRLWQATFVALDQEVQESVEHCLDEGLTNEVLRARVGAVNGLLQFRAVLEEYERKAKLKESEAEAEKEEEE